MAAIDLLQTQGEAGITLADQKLTHHHVIDKQSLQRYISRSWPQTVAGCVCWLQYVTRPSARRIVSMTICLVDSSRDKKLTYSIQMSNSRVATVVINALESGCIVFVSIRTWRWWLWIGMRAEMKSLQHSLARHCWLNIAAGSSSSHGLRGFLNRRNVIWNGCQTPKKELHNQWLCSRLERREQSSLLPHIFCKHVELEHYTNAWWSFNQSTYITILNLLKEQQRHIKQCASCPFSSSQKFWLAHARYAFSIGMCFNIFKNSFVKTSKRYPS